MVEFKMPSLGADMESGTLVEWFVKPGDLVKRGDIVAEVETQKGAIDVESFQEGTVQQLLIDEGATVPVGTPIALFDDGAEPVEQPEPAESSISVVAKPAAVAQGIPSLSSGSRIRATPVARRKAAELGIDLSTVSGTGPGAAISLADVERAAAMIPSAMPVSTGMDAMKAAIASAMARSKREIPHYYLSTDIDMKDTLDWLAEENARRSVTERLLYAALVLKSVALAVHDVPEMNGFWRDGSFRPSRQVHVGVAIALRGGGLVAPAIHDADERDLSEIMAALQNLVSRARSGKLRSTEISEPTITVSNLGEQGVGAVFGVIYPPQVALVGFGKIQDRPWAVDGLLGIRPIMTATLSADHRASVGHRGGVFLSKISTLLQEPAKL